VLNKRAVELTIAAGTVFGCDIANYTRWDRKNYFYPDSPKAYQISQLYAPICIGGGLKLHSSDKFIRLNRIHLEEDAGKLIHLGKFTYIDYNRTGVPLIEIVTEPDLRSADEAVEFVEYVRQSLVYAGVSDGKMEQGSLRVDANVSVMPEGADKYGTRAEIKNINSFKFIKNAIEYEVERQINIVENGGKIIQETRRYSEAAGETFSMRSKENAHDYRYFPDADVLPLIISDKDVEIIKAALCEPPRKRFDRYVNEYGLVPIDAETILSYKTTADLYDETVKNGANPQSAANIIKSEILRYINDNGAADIPTKPAELAAIINLSDNGKITSGGLKQAVQYMLTNKANAEDTVKILNLIVEENFNEITLKINEVLAANDAAVKKYSAGDKKVFGFLMGLCTKALNGKAHPQTINAELKKILEELNK
jgi:aspartyl-tRNA(Asn)/glutamyl-tRNA(Gln) amidotransferase subunit B